MAGALLFLENSLQGAYEPSTEWLMQGESTIRALESVNAELSEGQKTVEGLEVSEAALTGPEFKQLLSVVAGEINTNMPKYVISKTMEILNEHGLALKGSRIILIGLAYKKNVDDVRESPTFALWQLLLKHGAIVDYLDPYCPSVTETRDHPNLTGIQSKTLEDIKATDYQAAIISTAHDIVDYEAIAAHVQHGPNAPTVSSTMHLYPINGACQDVDGDATAFGHRDANFSMVILAASDDPASDDAHKKWVRDYSDAVTPHSEPGGYINFMDDDDSGRVNDNYGGNYDRLLDIKRKYDPDNLFRINQNIAP